MDKLVLGVAALALSAGAASAQALYPSDGYGPYGYGYIAFRLRSTIMQVQRRRHRMGTGP
jgi:opacity protein-like surface antigen